MTRDDLPVDPQNACTPERVKELAEGEGLGRNEIARRLDVTTYYVDKAAREAGVTWDRTHTREATAAMMADAAHERQELAATFREVSRVILAEVLAGDPSRPVAELRDLVHAAGAAAASDARLGTLTLKYAEHEHLHGTDSEAKAKFGEFLETVRAGFETLDAIPIEELEDGDPTEMIDFSQGRYEDRDDGSVGWE